MGAGISLVASLAFLTGWNVERGDRQVVRISGSAVCSGSWTLTRTNADTALEAIIAAVEGGTSLTVTLSSNTVDETEFGPATVFVEDCEIEAPTDAPLSYSGTLRGSGALGRTVPTI